MKKLPIWITGIALGVGAAALPPGVARAQDRDDTPGQRVDKDDVPEAVRKQLRGQVKDPQEIRYFRVTSGTQTLYAAQFRKGEEGKRRQILFASDGTVVQDEHAPGAVAVGSTPRTLRPGDATATGLTALRQRVETNRQAIEAERVEAERERARAQQAIDRRIALRSGSAAEREQARAEMAETERQAVERERQAVERAREAERDAVALRQQAAAAGSTQAELDQYTELQRLAEERRRLATETARLAAETQRGTDRTTLAGSRTGGGRVDDLGGRSRIDDLDDLDYDDRLDRRDTTRIDDRDRERIVRERGTRTAVRSGDLPRRVHDTVTENAAGATDMKFYRVERADGRAAYNVFFTNAQKRRVGMRISEDGRVQAGPTEVGEARTAGGRDRADDRDRMDDRGNGRSGTGGAADGGRLVRREQVSREDLPREARAELDRRLSRAKDVTVYRQEREGGTFYSAIYTDQGGQRMEVRVNSRGDVVSGPHETRNQPDDRR